MESSQTTENVLAANQTAENQLGASQSSESMLGTNESIGVPSTEGQIETNPID